MLIDEKPFIVTCAGVRHFCATETEARKRAKAEIEEWIALGYVLSDGTPTRRARIFYRDGSEIQWEYPSKP